MDNARIVNALAPAGLTQINVHGELVCVQASAAEKILNAMSAVPPGYEWDEGEDGIDDRAPVFKVQIPTGYGLGKTYVLRPAGRTLCAPPAVPYEGCTTAEFFRCTGVGAFAQGAVVEVVTLAGASTVTHPLRLGIDPVPDAIIAARFTGLQEGWVLP